MDLPTDSTIFRRIAQDLGVPDSATAQEALTQVKREAKRRKWAWRPTESDY